MTSFQKHTTGTGVSYEIINNFCVSEPKTIDLKSKLKRNYTVVTYLSLVAIVSFGAVFTFSALMKRFDSSYCFIGTPFKFAYNGSSEEIALVGGFPLMNENQSDAHTISSVQIDRSETLWNSHDKCDQIIYPCVVMALSAIIWSAMFVLCSMTDRNHRSLIPNPWRIVLPAFAFFLLMAVLSSVSACRSQGLLSDTCDSLSYAFDRNGTVPGCPDLFNHFTRPIGLVKASVLYFAYIAFTYSAMIFWWCLTLIMLLRCLLGVDFQRTEVEIKPLSTVPSTPTAQLNQSLK